MLKSNNHHQKEQQRQLPKPFHFNYENQKRVDKDRAKVIIYTP
jgi:hypothetical protein